MAKKKTTGASARAGATKKKASKKAVKKKAGASAKAGATKNKAGKVAKKAPKKPAKKKTPVRKAVAKQAVKTKKKAPAKKRKQIVGEGDYAATRAFDQDQAAFVKKNKAKIPALGKDAEKALDGPEGDALREAEATAAARSRDTF